MSFTVVMNRVQTDFMQMPELELTLGQAVRMWTLGLDDCRCVIDALVDAGFLAWTPTPASQIWTSKRGATTLLSTSRRPSL